MKILISEKLSEHKYKTPEGYLICTDAILARTGKQRYSKDELFADGDSTEVDVDRPYDEVFNKATLASFENKPITVEHPDEEVNVGNYKDYAVGYVRDVHQGKTIDSQDIILGNLVITDQKTINEIEEGQHTNLSCGYDCDIITDRNGGYIQHNIRGNHVALCEVPRAGITRIVDSKVDDMGWMKAGKRIPAHNTYNNRVSLDDLSKTLKKVMKSGNDEDIKILEGQLIELKKDYEADIKNSSLDKDETKKHYSKYKKLMSKYLSSNISKRFTKIVKDFVLSIKDSITDEFKPFFFKEDEDYWEDESEYVGNNLKVEKFMDKYDDYDDFINYEFTAKVLGSYGNNRENTEMKKYFEQKWPQKAKLAHRLFDSVTKDIYYDLDDNILSKNTTIIDVLKIAKLISNISKNDAIVSNEQDLKFIKNAKKIYKRGNKNQIFVIKTFSNDYAEGFASGDGGKTWQTAKSRIVSRNSNNSRHQSERRFSSTDRTIEIPFSHISYCYTNNCSVIPNETIDHKDGNHLNDDPNNLEAVSNAENIRRMKYASK